MKNPSKYIRQALLPLLKAEGTPAWSRVVPKGENPTKYILISSQTNKPTEVSKDCWEWECTCTIEAINEVRIGYSESDIVDDMEEKIISTVYDNFKQAGQFEVKNVLLIDTRPLDVETKTARVERRIITFEFWLNRV